MKAAALAAVVVAALLAGCAAGEPSNPNLMAPKMILRAHDDGSVTVYVHSAFGERDYDLLALTVDNATFQRAEAFSIEERIPDQDFFLGVRAMAYGQAYEIRGQVLVDEDRERVRILLLDEKGDWEPARTYNLPYERILERVPGDLS